ncbi:YkgJ family cysteine cluster protein [Candidatus Micrarchaeota archaeon]|nr:YkgJ family cysteine cluster protein [Candidatus Micrarchaeota archaeon]
MDWLGSCLECGNECCCGETVFLSNNDRKRIAKATGRNDFYEGHIIRKKNGKCPFYKKMKCSIHEIKPLDCRLYPLTFLIDEKGKPRLYLEMNCPKSLPVNKPWVDSMRRVIEKEIKAWSEEEKQLYSTLY